MQQEGSTPEGRSSGYAPAGNSSQGSMPALSLPKGGGAIRGIGEKFAANPVTGTGSTTIPIATSPGRSGFGPQLSLSYDSGAGNGPFGLGWDLSIPSITRKTDKGLPRYNDAQESDIFILSGAEDLVPVLIQNAALEWVPEVAPPRTVNLTIYEIKRYRPRIEGLFALIERWSNQSDPKDSFWRCISKDNVTTWYGKSEDSRIADPANPQNIFSWLICESYDDKGNVISYRYKAETSDDVDESRAHERNRTPDTRKVNRYLKHVRYANRDPYFPKLIPNQPWPTVPADDKWFFEVVFDYGEHHADVPSPGVEVAKWKRRLDPFSSYRACFEVRTYRLCQRVLMFHHFEAEPDVGRDCLVRSTDFTYSYEKDPTDAHNPIHSVLLSVSQSGYKRQTAGYLKKSLPPIDFEYTQANVDETVREVEPESVENLPYGLNGPNYQWVDLDGEGLSGILTEQGNGWFYKRNLSPINIVKQNGKTRVEARFAPLEVVGEKPSMAAIATGRQQLLDLAGDGNLDLVALSDSSPGFYERTEDEQWERFRPFSSLPNVDWSSPDLKFVDLTGDGHADVLITEDEVLYWYPSLAEEGFGPAERVKQDLDEEKGPRLVFADAEHSIYLADLSGDGLTDLVRIRNGEVCYWPNLGYGHFGARVTMDNSPWFADSDQFNPQSIQLADIDGSGVTDIIYLGRDGIDLYFNQSGNSWSKARRLKYFPQVDNSSAIAVTDLLGNGTACLVWSSPLPGNALRPMRYLDLMGGQKPHLLIRAINNLGAETVVSYAPSTKFYLEDKLNGKPWITKLPFPVHVVERVTTYDRVSRNRFVTRYAFHHGYFDGVEREFRGFGMVEQWDTEELSVLTADGELPADNIDDASHVPPVYTKTWFHTGVYLGRDRVSNFFAGLIDGNDKGEYYREPAWANNDVEASRRLLEDTILPAGLSIDEEREACRAVRGSMLRQEVYALDNSTKQEHPYKIIEQNFTVNMVQGPGDNRHAAFFIHEREAIEYHYERNPEDPRSAHRLTLDVDPYGNVLRSASIVYPRRQPDLSIVNAGDRAEQTRAHITCAENRFTDQPPGVDVWRTPQPGEGRGFELSGLGLGAGSLRFTFEQVRSAVVSAVEIPYEAVPAAGTLQKRLIEHFRTRYRPDDLGVSVNDPMALLPLGKLESLAIPGETYQLVFTPGLVAEVYGVKVTNSMLSTECRYVHSEGDLNWWIPRGRTFYSPGTADTAAQELAQAKAHFFLVRRYRDPFHTITFPTEAFVSYDPYDLLVQEARDALDNRVTAGERNVDPSKPLVKRGHDYRVLQAILVMDPNRDRSAVALDALGMVVGTALMGKPEESPVPGDELTATFRSDLTQLDIDQFLADPKGPLAATLLDHATTRIIYDLTRYWREPNPKKKPPAFSATLARETHFSEPVPVGGLKIQGSFSYFDGFGREIQKKLQAEPGPVPKRDPVTGRIIMVDGQPVMTPNDVSPRWVGSGWTVFNNKDKPMRQYEPFFTDTHGFEFDVRIGFSPVLFYDPAGRVVGTLHPNHTWEKVVFNPWQQETSDVNDTVQLADPKSDPDLGDYFKRLPDAEYLPTWHTRRAGGALGPLEQAAAFKAAIHDHTPTVAHFDSLGRVFLTIAHNKFKYSDSPPADPPSQEFYRTRIVFDIEGNQREVIDAKDRVVMRYDYDMLGNRIHQASMEAGQRWRLTNVVGKVCREWDSRDFVRRHAYDVLQRPTKLFVTEAAGERLAEQTIYGESRPSPEATNHRGKGWQLRDDAGIITNEQFDFKGNLVASNRELRAEYKTRANWASVPAPATSETFIISSKFDALGRLIEAVAPEGSVTLPRYNDAGLLEAVDVRLNGVGPATQFVSNIKYDAKGQRELIAYGNGASTNYKYDPFTLRLVKLTTTRSPNPDAIASQLFTKSSTVQDLRYVYDPAGNITSIQDAALKTIFQNGEQVEPVCEYTYDAIYRLLDVSGREHIGQTALDFTPPDGNRRDYPFLGTRALPNDPQALRNYFEKYVYDAVGNFQSVRHVASGGSWTRTYDYSEASLIEPLQKSNRLTRTTLGNGFTFIENYAYTDVSGNDVQGCLTTMNSMKFRWDYKDQLTEVDLQGGGTAFYVYDASGQRVRKVIERLGAITEERIYLGGYEVFRKRQGTALQLERETLHVMDDKRRIALVETRTQGTDPAPPQLIRYQLSNHLGSAALELDDQTQVVTYEEYHPYGTTAFQALRSQTETPKRYRSTGKERDEENGFYYHSARYYAPWLGRWTSCDPADLVDGSNVYRFARGNPLMFVDPAGTTTCDPEIASCYAPPPQETPEPNLSAPADIIIKKPGVRPMVAPVKLSLDPPQPPRVEDKSPGGFAQAAVTTAGKMAEKKVEEVKTIPGKIAQPYRDIYQAYEERGIEGLVTTAFDYAEHVLKNPPIVAGAEIAKGVGEDVHVVQESVGKAVSTSDPEEAGKQTAIALGSSLSIVTTVILPEETGIEQAALRRAALLARSSHVYEIRWMRLSTGETGIYKYGMSSGRVAASGTSYRANRQILKWNDQLAGTDYQLFHGELWGNGYNQMTLNRPQAFWAEQYKVSEQFQLTGVPPVGNQSPLPWGGTMIPTPPP